MGGKSKSWLRRLFGGGKNPEAPFGSAEDSDPKKNSKRRWPSFARSLKDTAPLKKPPPPPLLPCRGGGGGASGYLTEASATVTYSDASDDANKHAIAVAAATAAVAEAALAAAQAAAAVVRLTSGSSGRAADPAHGSSGRRRAEDMVWAAVKIQSAFRAYLARRALRALKGLVKLQALVRGHFVRKQTADMLRRMQALVRVQARVRATRSHHSSVSDSPSFTSMHWSHSYIGSPTPDKFVQKFHANGTKVEGPSMLKRCASNSKARDIAPQGNEQLGPHWPEQWIEDQYSWNNLIRQGNADDENSDKIVEVDTAKPHRLSPSGSSRTFQTPQHVLSSSFSSTSRSNTTVYSPSRHPTRAQKLTPSPLSREEVYSWNNAPKARIGNKEESVLYTAESSPQVLSASSRFGSSMGRCPFTPGRSEHSRNFYAGCLDHPSYMANTESSRAKVRSQSAPRQRLYFENPAGSLTKKPIHGWDVETNSNCGWDSRSIGYTASRRFDRLLSPNLR